MESLMTQSQIGKSVNALFFSSQPGLGGVAGETDDDNNNSGQTPNKL
jgi:hypothetical protein